VDKAYSTASGARRFGLLVRCFASLFYLSFFSLHIPTRATTNDASEPPSHTEPTSEDRKNVSQEHIYEWILSMPQRFRDCIEKGGQLTGYYQPPWSKAITVCIIFCRPPNPLRMNEKLWRGQKNASAYASLVEISFDLPREGIKWSVGRGSAHQVKLCAPCTSSWVLYSP